MNNNRRLLIGLAIAIPLLIVLSPVLLFIGLGTIDAVQTAWLRSQGYIVLPQGGTALAEKLVQEKRPASDCRLYRSAGLISLGPTDGDHQATCIYEYARMMQDPSACELLMPSSYGLNCVGAARKPDQCSFYKGKVSWAEDNKADDLPYAQCAKKLSSRGRMEKACCTIVLVSLVKSENDCSDLLSDKSLHDECQFSAAFKNHDPSYCESIHDASTKAACFVSAKALRQDPSICEGCARPVDRIDQLPK